MCHECNSSYKLAKDPTQNIDPLHSNAPKRRKAFYSYALASPGISISLELKTADIDNLTPNEIDIAISAAGRNEEVEGWKEVFGIEERFKAKCCAKNDGKYWLMQIRDECLNAGKSAKDLLQKINENTKASPWAECNFLKRPFLRACDEAGLI